MRTLSDKEKVPKNAPRVLVSFPVTRIMKDQINVLARVLQASSMAEVFRRSIHVMFFLLDARDKGYQVILRRPDGTEKELLVV